MTSEDSFEDLFRRAKGGDKKARTEFYQRFQGAIHRRVRQWLRRLDRRLRRVFDSLDFVQSVFLSYLRGENKGHFHAADENEVISLFLAIADRKMKSRCRDQQRLRRDFRRTIALGASESQIPERDESSPTQILANRELWQAIRSQMSDDEWALAERRAEGEEWAEIVNCLNLDLTPEAARKKLARALQRVLEGLNFSAEDIPDRLKM